MQTAPDTLIFDPDRPSAWRPTLQRDVVLVPWGENEPGGAKRAAGVFDAQSRLIPEAHCWRYPGTPITVAPVPPAETGRVERLAGRWLFGGIFYGHFGHFLVESTARLWAADLVDDLTGIVFYPKQKMTHERRLYRHMTPFFDACGLDHLAIRAPQSPVLIDELLTPPPGFGMNEMMEGSPDYRDWARHSLGRDIAPAGAEDIYVSRARLPSKRGSILLEERLERLMEAAGYTVFHPQEAPLAQQIAQWKAARRIVGLDGSALHLAALVAQPGTQVALINRGPSQNIEDYIRQFRRFAGIDALKIEALDGYYHPAGRRVIKRETYATLDFPATGAALATAGFIPSTKGWTAPDPAELTAAVAEVELGLGATLAHYTMAEDS
jgi:hypothetical protein